MSCCRNVGSSRCPQIHGGAGDGQADAGVKRRPGCPGTGRSIWGRRGLIRQTMLPPRRFPPPTTTSRIKLPPSEQAGTAATTDWLNGCFPFVYSPIECIQINIRQYTPCTALRHHPRRRTTRPTADLPASRSARLGRTACAWGVDARSPRSPHGLPPVRRNVRGSIKRHGNASKARGCNATGRFAATVKRNRAIEWFRNLRLTARPCPISSFSCRSPISAEAVFPWG